MPKADGENRHRRSNAADRHYKNPLLRAVLPSFNYPNHQICYIQELSNEKDYAHKGSISYVPGSTIQNCLKKQCFNFIWL